MSAISTVTVYVGNRLDAKQTMTVDEIAGAYWASPFADAEQYPWPRPRSFAVFLGASRADGGLNVTLDPDGVAVEQLLELVLDRCSDCGGTRAVPAGGWEHDADNGYVRCPTCQS